MRGRQEVGVGPTLFEKVAELGLFGCDESMFGMP
jgi:hypothetical protein